VPPVLLAVVALEVVASVVALDEVGWDVVAGGVEAVPGIHCEYPMNYQLTLNYFNPGQAYMGYEAVRS
jgi:hypothetical protein